MRTKISNIWRQWCLNFLWLTLKPTNALLGCDTDKLGITLLWGHRHGVPITDRYRTGQGRVNLDPPIINQGLVSLSCFSSTNPKSQCAAVIETVLWSSGWNVFRLGIFLRKWFELIRAKSLSKQTVFLCPDINQSIFYAMLWWSKDNPILITLNDQNHPYHYHSSLFTVDLTCFPRDHNAW